MAGILKRVVHSESMEDEIVIRLEAADGGVVRLPFTRDAAAQIVMAIRQEARRHAPGQTQATYAALYTLVACQPIQLVDGQLGLALTTQEGFELPVVLDAPGRAALRECLDQLGPAAPGDRQRH